MAEVLLARDMELGRLVALKLLAPRSPPIRCSSSAGREATAIASLNNTNVAVVYDRGSGWQPFIVMEYVAGRALKQIITGNAPLLGRGRGHASGARWRCSCLRSASSIATSSRRTFCPRGRHGVADFGVALGAGDDAHAARIRGRTADYIAPEQAQEAPRCASISTRSVWSSSRR
jgi:serine/threonine-protein kinase